MKFQHWPTMFLRCRRAGHLMAAKLFSQLFPPTQEKLNEVLSQDKCSACGGVFHEATGHRHSEKTVLCGPCCRRFFTWVKSHTNSRWGGTRFYDHVTRPGPRKDTQ